MMGATESKSLRSGALARITGLSADSIRHYEKIGILPRAARTQSGYRVFPQTSVVRVQVVQRALSFGFSLRELAAMLRARDTGEVPCERVYRLAQEKLKRVKNDIRSLKATEKQLTRILIDWRRRIQNSGSKQKAHLLQSLAELPAHPRQKHKFRK